MKTRLLLASLAAGVAFGCLQQSSAQLEPYRQAQEAPNQRQTPLPPVLEHELRSGQIEPVLEPERPPPAPSAKKAAPKRVPEPARVVACNGMFARDLRPGQPMSRIMHYGFADIDYLLILPRIQQAVYTDAKYTRIRHIDVKPITSRPAYV